MHAHSKKLLRWSRGLKKAPQSTSRGLVKHVLEWSWSAFLRKVHQYISQSFREAVVILPNLVPKQAV